MNGKHTPGPWAYEFVPEDHERNLPQSEWTGLWVGPSDETGRIFHTIFEGGVTHSPEDGDAEADAHLIAAAPALYEALQAAEDELSNFPDDNGDIAPLRRQINAALSRASGEGEEVET